MKYLSAKEVAKLWGISPRRVVMLCKEGRIADAQLVGGAWIIPEGTKKPADARIKSGKYRKLGSGEVESES